MMKMLFLEYCEWKWGLIMMYSVIRQIGPLVNRLILSRNIVLNYQSIFLDTAGILIITV